MKTTMMAVVLAILALFVVATPTYASDSNPPVEFPIDDFTTYSFGGPGSGGGSGGGDPGGGGGPAPMHNGHGPFNLLGFFSQVWGGFLQYLR